MIGVQKKLIPKMMALIFTESVCCLVFFVL